MQTKQAAQGLSNRVESIKNLSPERRALLMLRLMEANRNFAKVPRREIFSPAPLSFEQQRLWFIDQLDPGNPAYNMPIAIRIQGPLVRAALEQSLNEIVWRHEVFRTTFGVSKGEPVQVISSDSTFEMRLVDLRNLSREMQRTQSKLLARSEAKNPFDLSSGPLLRAVLIILGETEHVLLLTTHHIISDGWSVGVFFKELAVLYDAFSAGIPSPLSELPVQYADFASWQRRVFQENAFESQLAYWKQQLRGPLPLLELPFDRPRPRVQTFEGASQPLDISKALAEKIKALSKQEGVTVFMTVLAAFKTLLYRYSGVDDVIVGTDTANRGRREIEGVIGLFANQLVLRTNLSGNIGFRELLGRVRDVATKAYAHQDLPFEKLVQELKQERDQSRTPLFQIKFVFPNSPLVQLKLSGLNVSQMEYGWDVAKFDLTLFINETDQGLSGWVEYNTGLFDDGTITKMMGQFQTILARVLDQPDIRIDSLPLFTEEERKQQAMDAMKRDEANRKRFMKVTPKPVKLPQEDLIKFKFDYGEKLPLVLEPGINGIDLIDWAKSNVAFIEKNLLKHGAILFRGFGIDSPPVFEEFAQVICANLFSENGEHPRQSISGNVYTPVFYPPDQKLLWHNENSFNYSWPMKILFCCVAPPPRGGETPIVDSRKVFELVDPKIREKFINKGIMYVRNYGSGPGLDWRTVFQTSKKSEVEAHCRSSYMDFEWKKNDVLTTRSVRLAVAKHMKTGEMVWFNQAQHWHLSCLDAATRESLQSLYREEDLPRNCYYGDGSPIEDSVMQSILEVYQQLEVCFPWEKGDVLMLDNMLTAHARNPYVEPRKLLVTMGEMISTSEVQQT